MTSCLSGREDEILQMAAKGATDKEICARLCIAMPTVRTHWSRIRTKLGVLNRSHAVAVRVEESLLRRASGHPPMMIASMQRDPLSYWIWNVTRQKAFVDDGTRETFGLPPECENPGLDELLQCAWAPDQGRLRQFLLQSDQLRTMSAFECRFGEPGRQDRVVRTVTLTTQTSPREGIAVLMASIVERKDAG